MGGGVGGETEGSGDVGQGLQDSPSDAAALSASICIYQRVGRWKALIWVGGVGKEELVPRGRSAVSMAEGMMLLVGAGTLDLPYALVCRVKLLLELLLLSST